MIDYSKYYTLRELEQIFKCDWSYVWRHLPYTEEWVVPIKLEGAEEFRDFDFSFGYFIDTFSGITLRYTKFLIKPKVRLINPKDFR